VCDTFKCLPSQALAELEANEGLLRAFAAAHQLVRDARPDGPRLPENDANVLAVLDFVREDLQAVKR
jgi:hypothetical protein